MNDSSNTASAIISAAVAGVGLASGGNTAAPPPKGWQGTVHDLTAADKASNFRRSLDRQRAAAHPQAAATGNAIINATLEGALRINLLTPPDEHTIKPFADMKKPDRQGEWEDRITRVEAKVAKLGHAASEQQSPFKSVFLAGPNPANTGKTQQWQEMTANGSNIAKFQDGRNCTSGTSSGQILDPGTSGAFVLLEIPNGADHQYWKIAGENTIDLRITGSTQDGANKRWKYDWVEVEKTGAGYGGWTTKSGGRVSSAFNYAYNRFENMNGASGLYGNGVNSANLVGSMNIQPAPSGLIVSAQLLPGSGNSEIWFSYANGVDGSCT